MAPAPNSVHSQQSRDRFRALPWPQTHRLHSSEAQAEALRGELSFVNLSLHQAEAAKADLERDLARISE